MKKILVLVAFIFLSLNVNAEISQSGITNLKQLDKNGIIDLVNGNQLTGFISDGPFEGPITQTFYKDGKYETIFENKIYKGIWKVEGKKFLTKNNNASNFGVMYWYTGNKDDGTYAYIIAQGKIFHQYHELKSIVQVNQDKKKAAERKRIADAKKAEEKKKAAERKRIADAKKAEEKKKIVNNKKTTAQIKIVNSALANNILLGTFKTNPNNLRLCQRDGEYYNNCWGIQTWSGNRLQNECFGDCPITEIIEGEFHKNKLNGLAVFSYDKETVIGMLKDNNWENEGVVIEGWGYENRSECKLYSSKRIDGKWVNGEKTNCSTNNEFRSNFPAYDCNQWRFHCVSKEKLNSMDAKLRDVYVNYLILKNLNSTYGNYSSMDEIKKLTESIENYYANKVDTSIDILWDTAVTKFNQEYEESISTFDSFYSTQGESLYNLILMSLNQQANEVGASTSDIKKDF